VTAGANWSTCYLLNEKAATRAPIYIIIAARVYKHNKLLFATATIVCFEGLRTRKTIQIVAQSNWKSQLSIIFARLYYQRGGLCTAVIENQVLTQFVNHLYTARFHYDK